VATRSSSRPAKGLRQTYSTAESPIHTRCRAHMENGDPARRAGALGGCPMASAALGKGGRRLRSYTPHVGAIHIRESLILAGAVAAIFACSSHRRSTSEIVRRVGHQPRSARLPPPVRRAGAGRVAGGAARCPTRPRRRRRAAWPVHRRWLGRRYPRQRPTRCRHLPESMVGSRGAGGQSPEAPDRRAGQQRRAGGQRQRHR